MSKAELKKYTTIEECFHETDARIYRPCEFENICKSAYNYVLTREDYLGTEDEKLITAMIGKEYLLRCRHHFKYIKEKHTYRVDYYEYSIYNRTDGMFVQGYSIA